MVILRDAVTKGLSRERGRSCGRRGISLPPLLPRSIVISGFGSPLPSPDGVSGDSAGVLTPDPTGSGARHLSVRRGERAGSLLRGSGRTRGLPARKISHPVGDRGGGRLWPLVAQPFLAVAFSLPPVAQPLLVVL